MGCAKGRKYLFSLPNGKEKKRGIIKTPGKLKKNYNKSDENVP